MAAPDAFKPQGKEVVVVQGGDPVGAELGRHVRTQGQPLPAGPAPRTVQQGGERFHAATPPVQMGAPQAPPQVPAPAAAPPVPSAPQVRGQFQPAPQAESVQQQLGAQQPPVAPQPPPAAQQPPAAQGGVETFEFYIDGIAPDGTQLTSGPFLGQFPAGSRLERDYRYTRVRG